MSKVLFFGYGAFRDKKMIQTILDVSGLKDEDLRIEGGYGARVDNAVLAIQSLDQVPEEVRETLRKVWGDTFRSYTLKPGNGQVAGVVWELNDRQYKAIKEWEMDGVWREIKEIDITTSDQRPMKAFTTKVLDESTVKEIVDGLHYENNLNKEGMKAIKEFIEDEYRIREIARVRAELENFSKI